MEKVQNINKKQKRQLLLLVLLFIRIGILEEMILNQQNFFFVLFLFIDYELMNDKKEQNKDEQKESISNRI